MGKNILQYLFSGYLKLLKKTVAIEWQEIQFVTGNQVFGFWHEDSFLMNLVLEELSGKTSPVDVIVTADTRGDYIEHMLQACGGHALRVPDGFAAFGALKKILQDSYEQTRRKSASQFTIMEKLIKNKFLTFRQGQKLQNVVYC